MEQMNGKGASGLVLRRLHQPQLATARGTNADAADSSLVRIDLHGFHPRDFVGAPMAKIIEQAWEMGAQRLRFVHGHARARGISPGFYNTKTGYFGLRIRRELRHNAALRVWIKHTTLDCGDWGTTTVKLKANRNPTRRKLDLTVLPERRYAR
jgi:hypothetical protein